jgi:hypothetical protein
MLYLLKEFSVIYIIISQRFFGKVTKVLFNIVNKINKTAIFV